MPAYFPLELIHAAGGYPVQLWGAGRSIEHADAYLQSYCCSVARSLLALEMRGITGMVAAYAFTSLCDTLINLREVYRRLFAKPTVEFSIPATADPRDAQGLSVDRHRKRFERAGSGYRPRRIARGLAGVRSALRPDPFPAA